MINIAIVVEANLQQQIKLFFENFEKKHKTKFKKNFFSFSSNNMSFLEQQKDLNFNLIFILNLNRNPHAFDLAKKIKENNPNCEIVFASSSAEFAVSGYKIGLSSYLIYPFSDEDFNFAIEKVLKTCKKQTKYILINSNWQKISIEISKIQFIEKIGHNVVIHTSEKIFSTRSTLTSFIKNFKNIPNFVHCVRGAIVNLAWVDSIEPQNFLMKTGERISIRRQDRKKMKQIYGEFLIYNGDKKL